MRIMKNMKSMKNRMSRGKGEADAKDEVCFLEHGVKDQLRLHRQVQMVIKFERA